MALTTEGGGSSCQSPPPPPPWLADPRTHPVTHWASRGLSALVSSENCFTQRDQPLPFPNWAPTRASICPQHPVLASLAPCYR